METKELKIEIPDGFEIDKENSSFEKIVFKKKEDTKPRSWEEYCHTRLDSKETRFGYTIGCHCEILIADWDNSWNCSAWRDVLPTKELTEAFLAMMQLMSLRQAWIGDWKPDYNNPDTYKWYIIFCKDKFEVFYSFRDSHCLSFPTDGMAKDFMNTFKDLLEVAKPLI